MDAQLEGNPDFGHVRMALSAGDRIFCEAGAMASMTEGIQAGTKMLGGLGSSLLRSAFGGQSMMVGEYTAERDAELVLAPMLPGEVVHMKLSDRPVYTQAGSFLACTPGVTLDTEFTGMKALFSGESMFFLRCAGQGDLWIGAYGSIEEEEVGDGLVVNTGNVVAWESGLDWEVTGMGSLKSTLFSGEGLVLRFSGRGKVWVQTRDLGAFAGWLSGFLRR